MRGVDASDEEDDGGNAEDAEEVGNDDKVTEAGAAEGAAVDEDDVADIGIDGNGCFLTAMRTVAALVVAVLRLGRDKSEGGITVAALLLLGNPNGSGGTPMGPTEPAARSAEGFCW